MSDYHTHNPLRDGRRLTRITEPCTLVIFGATGDLTQRKLMPALYHLFRQDLLPSHFQIIAFARRSKTTDEFRKEIAVGLTSQFAASDEDVARFLDLVRYHQGDFTQPESHAALKGLLLAIEGQNNAANSRLYYLSTPPSQYEAIIFNLGATGLAHNESGWTRIIIEKPFGRDLHSAQALNRQVRSVFEEDQIYRIDHYLGKETVQNILVFRFANGIFEPTWNRQYISEIQITVAETLGVEGRGKFYEETGILRDIVQNHMLQLLCLCAMEPPSSFEANQVRDEKVKVLRAIQPIATQQVERMVVRGQYGRGSLFGENHPGYLEEEGVAADSTTETFVAMKLMLNNWRWAGVPFYLRAGKRLPRRVTEIAIHFKDAPLSIFGPGAEEEVASNLLVLNIQPDEGISLRFDSKVPGAQGKIRPVTMDFRYGTSFGRIPPDAYERLLLDAMLGDSTLFTRLDENEMAWRLITPILKSWEQQGQKILPQYPIGSWGPAEADELIRRDHFHWRRI